MKSGRFYFLTVSLVIAFSGFSQQIQTTDLSKSEIPSEVKFTGNFKKAIGWIDAPGKRHIVLLSESGIYDASGNRSADLFASHFSGGKTYSKDWEIKDFVHDCPVDVIADFVGKDIPVTDLDHNGLAEIWILYKISCRGDVSPDEMKLIMYEGSGKFSMRGENQVIFPDNQKTGGTYVFDAAFLSAPIPFREFAKKFWSRNLTQKM